MQCLNIEQRKIKSIKGYKKNARVHSVTQVNQIAASIKVFGFNVPILIDSKGVIIAGHGRHAAALKLGLTEVPCVELSHMSKQDVKAFRIADNSLALNSDWDFDLLSAEIGELAEFDDFDIEVLGVDVDELKGIDDFEFNEPPDKSTEEKIGLTVLFETNEDKDETFKELIGRGLNVKSL